LRDEAGWGEGGSDDVASDGGELHDMRVFVKA
jgi:hypothetical protein